MRRGNDARCSSNPTAVEKHDTGPAAAKPPPLTRGPLSPPLGTGSAVAPVFGIDAGMSRLFAPHGAGGTTCAAKHPTCWRAGAPKGRCRQLRPKYRLTRPDPLVRGTLQFRFRKRQPTPPPRAVHMHAYYP
jgi:hypothetical protein